MGCGSSQDRQTHHYQPQHNTHRPLYRDNSSPSTVISFLEHRTEPDGHENDADLSHDMRPRQRPQVEWWAHPPTSDAKVKDKVTAKNNRKEVTAKNNHTDSQPSQEHPGHVTYDSRKNREDKTNCLLVTDVPLDL